MRAFVPRSAILCQPRIEGQISEGMELGKLKRSYMERELNSALSSVKQT